MKILSAVAVATLLAGCSPSPPAEPTRADLYSQAEVEVGLSHDDRLDIARLAIQLTWDDMDTADQAGLCLTWRRDPTLVLAALEESFAADLPPEDARFVVTEHFTRSC